MFIPKKIVQKAAVVTLSLLISAPALSAVTGLTPIGRFAHNDAGNGEGGSEIVAFDKTTNRLFVVNAANKRIDVLNASDPTNLSSVGSIDATKVTGLTGGAPNSVAVHNGLVAIAIEASTKQDKGVVAFFNASDLAEQKVLEAGALPDMVTFSPDGKTALVANEGEPSDDYTNDPEGSVSIVDLSNGVANATIKTADFTAFNSQKDTLISNGVRIFGPNASVAQDLEPEYITVANDSKTAWVGLQENNALAKVDIASATITDIFPFGFKDHSVAGNGFDASNKDSGINIKTHSVLGMYQPDAISSFFLNGKTYVFTANEGDARDYGGFSEEYRVKDFASLDSSRYPASGDFQNDANLGRLKTTSTLGADLTSTPSCNVANKDSVEGVCEYDQIHAYGARSFSIWDTSALKATNNTPTFDSGDQIEQNIAADATFKALFNANGDENAADARSDDKGAEPEAITIGKVGSKVYAFVGLERIGGIMIYDVTTPTAPTFIKYVNFRNTTVDLDSLGGRLPEGKAATTLSATDAGDVAPEGVIFIPASDTPTDSAYLVVANELSNTTTIFAIDGSKDTDGDGSPDAEDSQPSIATTTNVKPANGGSNEWQVKVSSGAIAKAELLENDDPRFNTTGKPTDRSFTQGVVSYSITGLTNGASVTVELTYPKTIPADAKVFKMTDNGFEELAATFSGSVATITLTDGGTGDADGVANGVIVDPVTIGELNSSGSGGSMNAFWLLLIGLLAVTRRFIKSTK